MSQALAHSDDGVLDTEASAQRSARQTRRGSLGAASALGVVALVGAICVAADPASSHAEERRTRAAVEGSAMAGAAALATGGDAVDAAAGAIARSGLSAMRDTILVHRPPVSGRYAGHADAIEIVLIRAQAVGMAHMALGGAMPMRIRAVAAVVTVPEACPGALDRSPCLVNEAATRLRAPLLVE